jgi:SOS-response transcriptional repressor LexA
MKVTEYPAQGWFPEASADSVIFTVHGDSMTGAGIRDRATVCMTPQDHADDGQIVIAVMACPDGRPGGVIKRYRVIDGQPWLYSEHPGYPPKPAGDVVILGVISILTNWLEG